MECLFNLDASILLWIQENIRTPWLTVFFKAVTSLGNAGIFWILLSMGLIIYAKTRQTGIRAMTALVISFVINNLFLKNVIARTRPYEVIEGLTRLIEKPSDYSFPSGHTASSFCGCRCSVSGITEKIRRAGFDTGGAYQCIKTLFRCALSNGCVGGSHNRQPDCCGSS